MPNIQHHQQHIIPFLLNIQTNIKLYHWMTEVYSRHVASDKLYTTLSECIDRFVETYIGKYGRPKFTKGDLRNEHIVFTDGNVTSYLDKITKYLTNYISLYTKENDFDLLSIRDEIFEAINQSKYLFSMQ